MCTIRRDSFQIGVILAYECNGDELVRRVIKYLDIADIPRRDNRAVRTE